MKFISISEEYAVFIFRMMMEICFSEVVPAYQISRCHDPENSNFVETSNLTDNYLRDGCFCAVTS
jgi:hypothetical protein